MIAFCRFARIRVVRIGVLNDVVAFVYSVGRDFQPFGIIDHLNRVARLIIAVLHFAAVRLRHEQRFFVRVIAVVVRFFFRIDGFGQTVAAVLVFSEQRFVTRAVCGILLDEAPFGIIVVACDAAVSIRHLFEKVFVI